MTMLPRNSAKTPSESSGALLNGSLVFYENQGTSLLGVINAFQGKKYTVLNELGESAELPAERIHQLPERIPTQYSQKDQKAKFLASLHQESKVESIRINLEKLWKKTDSQNRGYTNNELCTLCFGSGSLKRHIALRMALLADSIYFKRKKELFFARSPEAVEELQKAEQQKREQERHKELAIQTLEKRLHDSSVPFPPETVPFIELLEDIASDSQEIEPKKMESARQLLNQCRDRLKLELNGPREVQAFELLRRTAHFNNRTDLAFLRYRLTPDWSESALSESKQVAQIEINTEGRSDLTHLAAMTIDDRSTRDMDDALTVEPNAGGYRVGIHISDVASYITPGSAIDCEARLRATSIYSATRTVNMFPDLLAENACSLLQGSVRPSLSVMLDVNHNFDVTGHQIIASVIKIARKLSYEDADDLLEKDDSDLVVLYNVGTSRETHRIEQGAIKVSKKDALPVVGTDGEVGLNVIDEAGPARNLIGELMIVANEFFAAYAASHRLPLVFRTQELRPKNEIEIDPETAVDGPAKDYAIKSTLKPTRSSLTPGKHAALGLKAYIQATSPIRRYADLCNQRQIFTHLQTGKPYYSRADFEKIIEDIESPVKRAGARSKDSKRFWILRYLEENKSKMKELHATVLRTDMKTPLVEIEELYIPALARLSPNVKAGDRVRLTIVSVNAVMDELRLEQI